MKRIKITDRLDFSQLVYGMWRLGDDADTSSAHVIKKIYACLDQGITTMDQADIYGDYGAEQILGEALKAEPSLRNKIEIVTKCGIVAPVGRYADARVKHYDTSRDHLFASVDHSLKAMNIDHIDLLLIHRPDPLMNAQQTGEALDDLVKSGKVGAVGVSNFKPHDFELLQSSMTTLLATNQIEMSLAHIAPFSNGDLAYHQMNTLPIMAWSPLGGGALLTGDAPARKRLEQMGRQMGVEPSALAVAFLLAHPAFIVPVLGTNNLERIAKISDALEIDLDRQSWFQLYEAALCQEVA